MKFKYKELRDAYIAGFVDGEGYIGIYQNGKDKYGNHYMNARVIVGQKHPEVLDLISSVYGGKVYLQVDRRNGTKHYRIDLSGDRAERLLNDILPYAIEKREQVILALQAREILKKSRTTERHEVIDQLLTIKDKIKKINSPMGFGRLKEVVE